MAKRKGDSVGTEVCIPENPPPRVGRASKGWLERYKSTLDRARSEPGQSFKVFVANPDQPDMATARASSHANGLKQNFKRHNMKGFEVRSGEGAVYLVFGTFPDDNQSNGVQVIQ